MMPGTFERNLRTLNRKLRVYCGDNDRFSAGIFMVSPSGEYMEICGADKNEVPEFTTYEEATGRIIKSGWRRVLKILIGKGLVRKTEAEKIFGCKLNVRQPGWKQVAQNDFTKKLASYGIDILNSGVFK